MERWDVHRQAQNRRAGLCVCERYAELVCSAKLMNAQSVCAWDVSVDAGGRGECRRVARFTRMRARSYLVHRGRQKDSDVAEALGKLKVPLNHSTLADDFKRRKDAVNSGVVTPSHRERLFIVAKTLCDPFKPSAFWWKPIFLLVRVGISASIIIFARLQAPGFQAFLCALLSLAYLSGLLYFLPYNRPTDNFFAIVCFTSLLLGFTFVSSLGLLRDYPEAEAAAQVMVGFIFSGPGLCFLFLANFALMPYHSGERLRDLLTPAPPPIDSGETTSAGTGAVPQPPGEGETASPPVDIQVLSTSSGSRLAIQLKEGVVTTDEGEGGESSEGPPQTEGLRGRR
ncbi:unnamed protein product [Vitrella brassicaformis CCMP3155]|uniref:Uncharacterized protein n=1 Tax=Vitrella brassicaformis (strain CCMP3155) TaxID=1169540 RepID=A0A0G4GHV0_VITBC|nr:unnamed protein product [Vitrella brassicaformis CCMP3155]|eukprot:CEM29327.1 unnamed protein product [Vitrella brassicaformis CCMP3155]